MRCLGPLLLLLAIAGCGDRRNFDERYSDTSRKLEEKARQLDANLAEANLAGTEEEPAPEPLRSRAPPSR